METGYKNPDVIQNTTKLPEGIGHADDSGFASIAGNDNAKSNNVADIKFSQIPEFNDEAQLRKKRLNEEARLERKRQHEEYNKERQEQLFKRLKHLVTKSKFYSDVIMKQLSPDQKSGDDIKNKKKTKGKSKNVNKTVSSKTSRSAAKKKVQSEEEKENEDVSPPPTKRTRRMTKANSKYDLKDYVTDDIKKNVSERRQLSLSQDDIEKELNTESDEEEEEPGDQKNIELKYFHGELRDYQKVGLKWLIALNEKGINGILADEMGLGKTVQVIALIAYLIEKKQPGPFLIIAPLSTIPNWMSEFKRFTPDIPVLLLHGPPEKRAPVLKAKSKKVRMPDGYATAPVIMTTYEYPIADAAKLRRVDWRYIVVDEAQRIKNHETQLAQTIRKFKSISRLLLTGTPLQNNLAELWALLNFLLPDIFNDLDVFQSWFDAKEMQNADATEKFLEQEKERHVMGALREILKPFMLRREKSDVCKEIPPMKEIIVYAPITQLQKDLYVAILNRDYDEVSMKEQEKLIIDDVNGVRPKRRCAIKNKFSSTYDSLSAMLNRGSEVPSSMKKLEDISTYAMFPASPDLSSSSSSGKSKHSEYTPFDFTNSAASTSQMGMQVSRTSFANLGSKSSLFDDDSYYDNRAAQSNASKMDADTENKIIGSWQKYANIDDRNKDYFIRIRGGARVPIYKQIVNHPYLIHCPLDHSGLPSIDEDLVTSSGKFLVLDMMLKKLHERGHKVLLFSTFVMILNIIADYLTMRPWKFLKLDGGVDVEVRDKDIKAFNEDPSIFIYLISTRAGGVGLNLMAADTVIIFDSDWNPQADIQAMARCHRIGQTKPVVVYRFCTKGTIDEEIIRRAESKRKLEKMVISKKILDANGINELRRLLISSDQQVVTSANDVFTEEELDKLLDRSDMIMPEAKTTE